MKEFNGPNGYEFVWIKLTVTVLQKYCEQNHDDTTTVHDNAYMGEHFLIYCIHPQFRKNIVVLLHCEQ